MSEAFFDYPGEVTTDSGAIHFAPDWTEREWTQLVEGAQVVRFKVGQRLVQRGDADRNLLIVTLGSLDVLIPQGRKGKPISVAILPAGSVAGEQAFLDGLPRSADIVALEDGEAVLVSPEAFDALVARHPGLAFELLRELARMLSAKLRQANEFISKRLG